MPSWGKKAGAHPHLSVVAALAWNAAASGLAADSILTSLTQYSKYDVPGNIPADVHDYISRFGRIKLRKDATGGLLLSAEDPLLMLEVSRQRKVKQFILEEIDATTVRVDPAVRGHVKHALVDVGYPAEDLAGYVDGAGLTIELLPARQRHRRGVRVAPLSAGCRGRLPRRRLGAGRLGRDRVAVRRGQDDGGHGRDGRLQTNTLILTTNTSRCGSGSTSCSTRRR